MAVNDWVLDVVLCLLSFVLLMCAAALRCCCAAVAQAKQEAGGFWVLRPDSGDPVQVVLMVRSLCRESAVVAILCFLFGVCWVSLRFQC